MARKVYYHGSKPGYTGAVDQDQTDVPEASTPSSFRNSIMESRLAALAAAANISREQVNQLATRAKVPLETLSNYHQNDFIKLCQLHSDKGPEAPPAGTGEISGPIQVELSAGLSALRVGLTSLAENLETRNIREKIPTFDGTARGPEEFHKWIRELERQKSIHSLSDSSMRKLTSCTVSGSASDYLGRVFKQSPDIQWSELKASLQTRYSNFCSSIVAQNSLQAIRQGPRESVQSLAERVITSSELAFSAEERESPVVVRNLINVFIKALKDDFIARRLIQKPPASLDKALEMAIETERNNYTFDITRGRPTVVKHDYAEETAMEVDRIKATSPLNHASRQDELVDVLVDNQEETQQALEHMVEQQTATCQAIEDLSASIQELATNTTSPGLSDLSQSEDEMYKSGIA